MKPEEIIGLICILIVIAALIETYYRYGKARYVPKNDWNYGEPPLDVPRSFITTGMRVHPNNPKQVVTCWKYNSRYQSLS